MPTLTEVQYGGTIRLAPKSDEDAILDVANDHSNEITSVVLAIAAEQITSDASFGTPITETLSGALSYTVTLNVNELLNTTDSAFRKLRDALINAETIVLHATFLPGPASTTNEELRCEFRPTSINHGGTPGAKRQDSYTYPVVAGTVVFATTPVTP